MANRTPEEIAEKYARNTANAVPEYTRGVERVEIAPGISAAAKADKYIAGVQRSFNEGKWQENVAAVPVEEWRDKTLSKGVSRYQEGTQAAQDNVAAFHGELQDFRRGLDTELQRMPDSTQEQRLSRMMANARGMAKFRRRRRR